MATFKLNAKNGEPRVMPFEMPRQLRLSFMTKPKHSNLEKQIAVAVAGLFVALVARAMFILLDIYNKAFGFNWPEPVVMLIAYGILLWNVDFKLED